MARSILIVDDDPVDIEFISRALIDTDESLDIATAFDGFDAVELLKNRAPPDIVLIDLNMPRMDGLQFLDTIKSDPCSARIPVIVFSTAGTPEEIARSYERRANAYVTKPNSIDDYNRVARAIRVFWLDAAAQT